MGADEIFKMQQDGASFADEDIDEILKRAEEKTKTIMGKYDAAQKEGLSSDMWTFGGDDYKVERKAGGGGPLGFVDIGKRDRKAANYSENVMFNDLTGSAGGGPGPRKAKDITFSDFHFFNETLLRPLLLKERGLAQEIGCAADCHRSCHQQASLCHASNRMHTVCFHIIRNLETMHD